MKKFCESSEQLFPANLQGQYYKCQEVRLYILKELKALDSGKNMDKNKSSRSNHVLYVLILNAMFYAGISEWWWLSWWWDEEDDDEEEEEDDEEEDFCCDEDT